MKQKKLDQLDENVENEIDSPPESLWYRLYHKPRVLEKETCFYILVSSLDFFMTYLLLSRSDIRFVESNPIAKFFLNHWGIRGMIYFKFALVAFVALITQYIAITHYRVAKNVLNLATVIVTCVVIYSLSLYVKDRYYPHPVPETPQIRNIFYQ